MRSGQRLVLDRLKHYLQKYLPAAQEVTEKDVLERGAQPGTPKFAKLQHEMIAARLDARPKKVVVEDHLRLRHFLDPGGDPPASAAELIAGVPNSCRFCSRLRTG